MSLLQATPARIEQAVIASGAAWDCRVIAADGNLAVCVVCAGGELSAVRRAIENAAVDDIDVHIVRVTSLPFMPDGSVDDERLRALLTLRDAATNQSLVTAPQALLTSPTDPLAQLDGGPLRPEAREALHLVQALDRAARSDAGCWFVDGSGQRVFLSYAELLHRARCVAVLLAGVGIGVGARVVLQQSDFCGHFTALWASILLGATPLAVAIPVDGADRDDHVARKLLDALDVLGDKLFVVCSDDVLARTRELIASCATAKPIVLSCGPADTPLERLPDPFPGEVAVLQLSSGSTGRSKCIQLTHRGVLSHVAGSRALLPSDDGVAAAYLNWLPLDHVVPLLMFHFAPIITCSVQVHIAPSVVLGDPLAWLRAIDEFSITHSWAPNFGFRRAADALRDATGSKLSLRTLRSLVNAGEQVTAAVVRDFAAAADMYGLPEDVMVPAFGMAEVCTCMCYQGRFDLETGIQTFRAIHPDGRMDPEKEGAVALVNVGVPTPGNALRIVDTLNRVLPQNMVGRLQLRSVSLTPGYLNDPAASREAFLEDGWFDTGDLGSVVDGRLVLVGRAKETILVRGAHFLCHDIEEMAGREAGVLPGGWVAAIAVPDQASGTEQLAVVFVPSPAYDDSAALSDLAKRIRHRIARSFGISPEVVPTARRLFARTTSGKIQRTRIRTDYMAGVHVGAQHPTRIAPSPQLLRKVWVCKGARPAPVVRATALVLTGAGRREAWSDYKHIELDVIVHDADSPQTIPAELLSRADLIVHDALDTVGSDWGERFIGFVRHAAPHLSARHAVLVLRKAPDSGAGTLQEPCAHGFGALAAALGDEAPCRFVRIVNIAATAPPHDLVGSIDREWRDASREDTVLLEGDARFVFRLEREPIEVRGWRCEEMPIGDAIVITGGNGGIAQEIARAVAAPGRAILLVGRSAAPPCGLPGVGHAQADVTDSAALSKAVDAFERVTGKAVSTILHLAGVFHKRKLAEESMAEVQTAARAKVDGAHSCRALLARRPECSLVLFSSVCASFGASGLAAYSCANAALQFLAAQWRCEGLRAYSIEWSFWESVGIARTFGRNPFARARGFLPLRPDDGVSLLCEVMQRAPGHYVVGLDEEHPRILRLLDTCELAGADSPAPAVKPAAPEPAVAQHDAQPGGEDVCSAIARVWGDVLRTRCLGWDDDFFALGGDSLGALEIADRVSRLLDVVLTMSDLVECPTVSAMSARVMRLRNNKGVAA